MPNNHCPGYPECVSCSECDPIPECDHDALRADVDLFFEKTTPIGPDFSVDGLIYRNCECGSTLALAECRFCGTACPSGDSLELKDGRAAHAACAIKRSIERGTAKVGGWVEVRS